MPELQELLTENLRDLLDAEKQLTKALPKMAKAAKSQELKQAFLDHTEMTKGQVTRLEQVFEALGERAKSKPCKAMKGLVEEAQEHVTEHEKGHLLDQMLIGAAQKVEHYEIASYGTARAIAKSMRKKDAVDLLQQTLKEEETTDKLLTTVALGLQKQMLEAEGETDPRGGSSQSSHGGSKKKKLEARSNGSGRAASKRGGTNGKRSSASGRSSSDGGSQATTDHEEIQRWAEERGAHPACVKGTGRNEVGMIRLDFPGYSGAESLQEISWEEFFEKFDAQGLALLYQQTTKGGQKSNFNKLVSREGGGRRK